MSGRRASSAAGRGSPIEMPLPASLEAMREQAAKMLALIDSEKARCYVQQMSNGHGDDDVFGKDGQGGTKTYAERMADLTASEERLRGSLPPVVLEALEASG